MQRDIRFLLVFLIIAIGVLVWLQCYQCGPIPNTGALYTKQNFTNINDSSQQLNPQQSMKINNLIKNKLDDESRSSRENKKVTSKIVDSILKNESRPERRSRYVENDCNLDSDCLTSNNQNDLINPLSEDINYERNSLLDSDQEVLDELIKEVNTGNDLIVNNPKSDLYRSKAKSINSAKKYRKISYKDSAYRYDFNDDGSPSQTSQDELNSLYDDALVFRNNEYNTNSDFTGFNDTNQNYGNANLNDFKSSGPQTQQEKIMSLYNSNEYLPNNNLLDKKLTKGFQILDNPVSVSNPNLIPVLKSIPVSSVMGSNRNQTYDIRAEPPCPKTVVSPFLNSTIMPDIYSTQRGCL